MPGHMQTAVDIVDHLGKNSGPVDRIDRSQMIGAFKFDIVKNRLDRRLGIVEGTSDRNIEDVGIGHRGHLFFLDLADPLMGM